MVITTLIDLLRETIDLPNDGVWENKRTLTLIRVRGAPAMGRSAREVPVVLELLGVDRSHGAVWNWTHDLAEAHADPSTAEPSRVAVDEKQIEINGKKWLYAVIDTGSKLLLDVDVYSRHETIPRRHFRIALLRNTTLQTLSFWSMAGDT